MDRCQEISKQPETSARRESKGTRGILAKSWFTLVITALVVHLGTSNSGCSTDRVGIVPSDRDLLKVARQV